MELTSHGEHATVVGGEPGRGRFDNLYLEQTRIGAPIDGVDHGVERKVKAGYWHGRSCCEPKCRKTVARGSVTQLRCIMLPMTRFHPFRPPHGFAARRVRLRRGGLAFACLLAITLTLTGCGTKGGPYSATLDITGSADVSATIGVSCNAMSIAAGDGVGESAYLVWEITGTALLNVGRVTLDGAIEYSLVEGAMPTTATHAIGPQTPSYVSWTVNGARFEAGGLDSDPQATGSITMQGGGSTGTFNATEQGSAISGEWTC